MNIFTVGYSMHTEEEFPQLLQDGNIDFLVDVRAFPGSRKFPLFHKDRMSIWLPESGIDYGHIKELGGRRNKSETVDNEINGAWENRSFHNYADYTLEEDFQTGLEKLKKIAENNNVAYCCFRLLISNWLALNGWTVYHILDGPKESTKIEEHVPGQWGAPPVLNKDGTVIYPK